MVIIDIMKTPNLLKRIVIVHTMITTERIKITGIIKNIPDFKNVQIVKIIVIIANNWNYQDRWESWNIWNNYHDLNDWNNWKYLKVWIITIIEIIVTTGVVKVVQEEYTKVFVLRW